VNTGVQLVAEITQAFEPFINVEKACLSNHQDTLLKDRGSESSLSQSGEVNRGSYLVNLQ
ncbi:MAG: hypothetical protein AAGC79_01640, partial [Pseudomonadota bacterium]